MTTIIVAAATITCCWEECGLTFQVPAEWDKKRRDDHTWWYFPNGHRQHFSGETEAKKLKREMAALSKCGSGGVRRISKRSVPAWRQPRRASLGTRAP